MQGNDRTVLLGASNPGARARADSGGLPRQPRLPFTPFDAEAAAKIQSFRNVQPHRRQSTRGRHCRRGAGASGLQPCLRTAMPRSPRSSRPRSSRSGSRSSMSAGLTRPAIRHSWTTCTFPGLRRAGDLQTAATMGRGEIVVHNAGTSFNVPRCIRRSAKLSATEIVALVRKCFDSDPLNRKRHTVPSVASRSLRLLPVPARSWSWSGRSVCTRPGTRASSRRLPPCRSSRSRSRSGASRPRSPISVSRCLRRIAALSTKRSR